MEFDNSVINAALLRQDFFRAALTSKAHAGEASGRNNLRLPTSSSVLGVSRRVVLGRADHSQVLWLVGNFLADCPVIHQARGYCVGGNEGQQRSWQEHSFCGPFANVGLNGTSEKPNCNTQL